MENIKEPTLGQFSEWHKKENSRNKNRYQYQYGYDLARKNSIGDKKLYYWASVRFGGLLSEYAYLWINEQFILSHSYCN